MTEWSIAPASSHLQLSNSHKCAVVRQRFPKFVLAAMLYGLATVLVPQTWVIKPTMQPFDGRLSASAPIERGRGMGEIWKTECSCVSSGETESAESTGLCVRLVPSFTVCVPTCVNYFETRKHSSRQRKSLLRCRFSALFRGFCLSD